MKHFSEMLCYVQQQFVEYSDYLSSFSD